MAYGADSLLASLSERRCKHEQEDAQAWLEELLEQAKDEYDDYDAKIAEAYAMADEYQALIEAQNEAIAQLIAAQEAMGVSGERAFKRGGNTVYRVAVGRSS